MRQRVFSEVHASPQSQMQGLPHGLEDDEVLIGLRQNTSYEGLKALASELCYRLRYREAIEIYCEMERQRPDDLYPVRQRAAKHINTLQPFKAIDDFTKSRQMGALEDDITYRIGIAYYLAGDWEMAMAEEKACLPLVDGEMGIAAIYWSCLAALKAGEIPWLLRYYSDDMYVGHHTSYRAGVRLICGLVELDEYLGQIEEEPDDLEYAMKAYAACVVLESRGRLSERDELLKKIVARDSFWIGYGYIAAFNDHLKLLGPGSEKQ